MLNPNYKKTNLDFVPSEEEDQGELETEEEMDVCGRGYW